MAVLPRAALRTLSSSALGQPAALIAAAAAAAAAGGILAASGSTAALSGAVAAALLLAAARPVLFAAAVALAVAAEPVAFGRADVLARPVGLTAGLLALVALAGVRRARLPAPLVASAGGYGAWTLASALWADDTSAALGSFQWWAVAAGVALAAAVFARAPRTLVRVAMTLGAGALAAAAGSVAGAWLDAGRQVDRAHVGLLAGVGVALLLAAAAAVERRSARIAALGAAGALVAVVGSAGVAAAVGPLAAAAGTALLLPRRRRGGAVLALAAGAAGAAALAFLPSVVGAERRLVPGDPSWRLPSGDALLGAGAGGAASVHDAYLQTLAELGPIGLALFGLTLLTAAWAAAGAARRLRGSELEPLAAGVLGGLAACVVAGFFVSSQLARPLWLVVGLAASLAAAGSAARDAELAAAVEYEGALERERLRLQAATAALDGRAGELEAEAARLERGETEVARGRSEVNRSIEEIARGLDEVARGREEVARGLAELARLRDDLERRRREDEERRLLESEERRRRDEEQRRREEEELRAARPEPEAEPVHGPGETPTLLELERLVDGADASREQREAWEIYLMSLRDVADVNGRLPATVDALVFEVFADLLES